MEELNIRQNNFTCLPATILLLSHLKHLDLSECLFLKQLPELPSLIQVLKADGCKSLQKIDDLCNKYKWFFKISLRGAAKLLKDQESENHLANMMMKSVVQKCAAVNHRLSVAVPGSKIPDWFSNKRLGNKVALSLPQNQLTKMNGLAVCCRYCPTSIKTSKFPTIKFESSGNDKLIDKPSIGAKTTNDVWIGYLPIEFLGDLCARFESEGLIISLEPDYNIMMECGVCVIYEDDIQPMTGNGSWVLDYDELGRIDDDSATSEDVQKGRWSLPSFQFGSERTGHQNRVCVRL